VTILVAPVASADPAPEGEDPDDGGLGNCVDINTSEWPPAITVDPTC
jgi:hypothetical protein